MNTHSTTRSAFIFYFFLIVGSIPSPVSSFAQTIGGIGAMLALDSAGGYTVPYIKSLLPNTPAAKSLKENLFIQKVNDVSCKNKSIEDVVGLVRGDIGTGVKIIASDDKAGEHASAYNLIRAAIATPATTPPADPKAAFYTDCANRVKQIRQQGFKIIKTYNSECGSYFFNFNADAGLYHIQVLYDIANGDTNHPFEAGVRVFDNNNEAASVSLQQRDRKALANSQVTEMTGDISFKKEGVGVISIKMPENDMVKKCIAMYIIVYK